MKLFELNVKKPKEFEGRSTEHGKGESSLWAAEQSIRTGGGKLCMYLVGDSAGLERHISEKVHLGFTDLSKHIVVEIAPGTCNALKAKRDELSVNNPEIGKVQVVCTNIVSYAEKVTQKFGIGSIGHVDFDTASAMTGELALSIVRLSKLGIDNIHIVVDQRNTSGYFEKMWPKEKGDWKVRATGTGVKKLRPPEQKYIFKPIIEQLVGDRYTVSEPKSYMGRSNNGKGSMMLMVVLNKK